MGPGVSGSPGLLSFFHLRFGHDSWLRQEPLEPVQSTLERLGVRRGLPIGSGKELRCHKKESILQNSDMKTKLKLQLTST